MNSRKSFRAVAALACATVLVLGVVWAASASSSKPATATAVSTVKPQGVAKLSAFTRRFRPNRSQRRQRRAIRSQIRRSPRSSIASTADTSRSRPVPIDGYAASVWIVPAADGSVCTFIPDPLDGWGAGCATAEEVASGSAVTLLGGGLGGPLEDAAIVAVVVPDGAPVPTVQRGDGSIAALDVHSNVAAAVLPRGALVRSGHVAVAVPEPPPG